LELAKDLKRPVDTVSFYKEGIDSVTVVVHSRGMPTSLVLNRALFEFENDDNRRYALRKFLKALVRAIPANPSTRVRRVVLDGKTQSPLP
jgi:hypothetical protein